MRPMRMIKRMSERVLASDRRKAFFWKVQVQVQNQVQNQKREIMKKNVLNTTIIAFAILLMGASLGWREADDGGGAWGHQVVIGSGEGEVSPIRAAVMAEESGVGIYESVFAVSDRSRELFSYLTKDLLYMLSTWRAELDKLGDPGDFINDDRKRIKAAMINDRFTRAINNRETNPNGLVFRGCPSNEEIDYVFEAFDGSEEEAPGIVGPDELRYFENFFHYVQEPSDRIYDRADERLEP